MAEDKKTISVKEFRMWIQGVEEMQAEEWVPDARQWKLIRAKIDLIDDTPPAQRAGPPMYGPRGNNMPDELANIPGANLVFQPMNTAPPSAPGMGAAIPQPSSLNAPPAPPQAPRMAHTPNGLPVSMASGNPTVPVKTPDDTSGKPYNSQFV